MFRKISFLLFIGIPSLLFSQTVSINPDNITIARDKWGVPHIFAPTNAEVAYGLAWANAEDAFPFMQDMLMAGKGLTGRVEGKGGAAVDFFGHAIGAERTVEKNWHTISAEYKLYLEGFCAGANAYAEAHPDEVKHRKIFPVTPKDVEQVFVVAFAGLSGVPGAVENAYEGKYDKDVEERIESELALGSNAFALSKQKMADSMTYFCSNPHFKIDGAFSFYEAHICSDEGMNVTGAIFQGGSSIFIGNNKDLAWGETFNHFDRVDVFHLEMHPSKKHYYKLGDEWKKLEKRPVWLKVRLKKWLTIPVRKVSYWSEFGPVIKSKKSDHYYAIRAFSILRMGAGEQYYRMNNATNLEEFRAAMAMQKIPLFNVMYADKEDNIYYLHNGSYPVRNDSLAWDKVMIGCDPDLIWCKSLTIDELPNVLNPDCGFVYNTNNTPFHATCREENDNPGRFVCRQFIDNRPGDNNRAIRLKSMLTERDVFTFEDVKKMKFDITYPDTGSFARSVAFLFNTPPEKYPEHKAMLTRLQRWDKVARMKSTEATVMLVSLTHYFGKKGYGDGKFVTGFEPDTAMFLESLGYAKDFLTEHYGTLDVPLYKVQRFARNGKDYGVAGFPDALMAQYARPWKDGKYKLQYGDSYTHFVAFDENGPQKIETLLPFSTYPNIEKYESQIPLYNRHETKTMSLDKEKILKEAVDIYSPKVR